jgi:hypothetical protein
MDSTRATATGSVQDATSDVVVDVGAATRRFLSLSALARDLGWRVIAVEPNRVLTNLARRLLRGARTRLWRPRGRRALREASRSTCQAPERGGPPHSHRPAGDSGAARFSTATDTGRRRLSATIGVSVDHPTTRATLTWTVASMACQAGFLRRHDSIFAVFLQARVSDARAWPAAEHPSPSFWLRCSGFACGP